MNRYLTVFVVLLVVAIGVYAQDAVTQDEVDDVASRMFCPVCENEPLDQCYNPTCIQWKREIADLLAEGYTPDEVIDSFVTRYGQHVVGVPQDPFLRFLSFSTPIIATIIAIVIGYLTFKRWQSTPQTEGISNEDKPKNTDTYRSQIERDLNIS